MREYYYPFESGLKAGTAQVYDHEIPGGQYSNLRPQAIALGLEDQFEKIKENYAAVNMLFGDLVKVTPSSKVVGDMAMYMTSNSLSVDDIKEKGAILSFPESVVSLFKGELGQPHGGFPSDISQLVLKDEKPFTDKPNTHLAPVDFEKEFNEFQAKFDQYCNELDFLSYKLYPKVFEDYHKHWITYGDVWKLPTLAFFYGLKNNEEIFVDIGKGKAITIKKRYKSQPDENGICRIHFEMNGQSRIIEVQDKSFQSTKASHEKAEGENEVGSPLQGRLAEVNVKAGDVVDENTQLFVIEAMKMETNVTAPILGKVKKIHIEAGAMVMQDDLVVELM